MKKWIENVAGWGGGGGGGGSFETEHFSEVIVNVNDFYFFISSTRG